MDFSTSYGSRQLSTLERIYATMEREGLGMIDMVKTF